MSPLSSLRSTADVTMLHATAFGGSVTPAGHASLQRIPSVEILVAHATSFSKEARWLRVPDAARLVDGSTSIRRFLSIDQHGHPTSRRRFRPPFDRETHAAFAVWVGSGKDYPEATMAHTTAQFAITAPRSPP